MKTAVVVARKQVFSFDDTIETTPQVARRAQPFTFSQEYFDVLVFFCQVFMARSDPESLGILNTLVKYYPTVFEMTPYLASGLTIHGDWLMEKIKIDKKRLHRARAMFKFLLDAQDTQELKWKTGSLTQSISDMHTYIERIRELKMIHLMDAFDEVYGEEAPVALQAEKASLKIEVMD